MAMDRSSGSANPPSRVRRWRRWILRIGIVLLIYTLIGFFLIPLIVRTVAVSQLRKLLDREVVIEKVRLNPFSFVAEVDGFSVKDPDGEPLLAWEQVRVDFQFTSVFLGPWRVREISVVRPYIRAQINPDYRFNFSDLIEKFSQETEPEEPASESSPLPAVVIDRLEIRDAAASYADLTVPTPFRRRLDPVNLRASDFRTAPGHTNAFQLEGATDAGGQFSFDGSVLLTPPEVQGRFDLQGLNLANVTGLYQDFVRFGIRDGSIGLSTEPHIRLGSSNRLAQATNTRFTLQSLKVGLRDAPENLVELDRLEVDAPFVEGWERDAHIREVLLDGVRLQIRRREDATFEFLDAARPVETTNAMPGSAQLAVTAFTNVLAMFSANTNVGQARLDALILTNASVQFLDESTAEPVRASVSDLTATVQNVTTLPDAAPTARLSLNWQTNGPLAIEVQARTTPPAVDVSVKLERWDLSIVDAYLADLANAHLEQAELSFSGRAQLEAPHDAEPSGKFEGEVLVSKLKTTHGSNNANLLLWDEFGIRGIKANLHPIEAVIDRIQLGGLQLWGALHADGTVNFLTAANVTNAVVAPSSAPAGDAGNSAAGVDSARPDRPTTTDVDASAELPPVYIASFVLTNATVHLSDELSDPDVRITVSPLNGVVNHLSTTNLQSGEFQFAGKLEPAGSFTIEGTVRPLDGPETTRVNLTSEGIDLTPTSPYAQRFLGYKLDRGSVSAGLQYEIRQRQIAATNHLMLDQLTLGDQVESPDAIKAPVKLGIKLLKDRDGRIELTVPLSGSVDDPQFNIGRVITDAFSSVLTKVITSPFGVLGALAGADDEETLDQLKFPPGESTLNPALVAQTAKIEKILYERPDLTLELLGSADPAQDAASDQAISHVQAAGVPAEPQPESMPVPVTAPPKSVEAAEIRSGSPADEAYARALAREFLESRTPLPPADSNEVQAAETRTDATPLAAAQTGEDQLRHLAKQRAEAVRAALLDSGRIEPGRITIKELTGLPPVGTEVRLSLQ